MLTSTEWWDFWLWISTTQRLAGTYSLAHDLTGGLSGGGVCPCWPQWLSRLLTLAGILLEFRLRWEWKRRCCRDGISAFLRGGPLLSLAQIWPGVLLRAQCNRLCYLGDLGCGVPSTLMTPNSILSQVGRGNPQISRRRYWAGMRANKHKCIPHKTEVKWGCTLSEGTCLQLGDALLLDVGLPYKWVMWRELVCCWGTVHANLWLPVTFCDHYRTYEGLYRLGAGTVKDSC